jgi:large subunit ribosomal protein L25
MFSTFALSARNRDMLGKGEVRRMRRLNGEVPAVIYGGKIDPQSISLVHKDVMKALENESFYAHIINLKIDGKNEEVVIKDIQRHPAKATVLHMDFLRINKSTYLNIKIPLHFANESACVGVRKQGGTISRTMSELEVKCLPKDIPEYIEVDVSNLAVGETLHISSINLPRGVESVVLSQGPEYDLPVAVVNKSKGSSTTTDASEGDNDNN